MPEVKEDLTQANPPVTEVVENQEVTTPPTVDWESDGNVYKKRYADSQTQVQPLVRTLSQYAEFDHNTRTWKPKTQAVSTQEQGVDFEKVLAGYDPDFVKALGGYTQKQIQDAIAKDRKEFMATQEYGAKINESRSLAISEFGSEFEFAKDGKMNTQSPLYQLANEIVHSKYALFNPDGTFAKYNTPDAEYLATCEAYAILAKRSKQQTQNKGQLNAIKGKGTGSAAVKRQYSYEEYNKLPNAEKDAYDLAQMEGR
ncbi:hypothetical protein IMZ68_05325 [Candidatus Bathyarchaeota archaeon]|nr:hypothetical protein [Candidatus Bathyarchaeota archaeon]